MPKGMFLLIHDELKGPQLKSSYYTSPISLPQEFISKLYMSHAGFKSSSHLEFKLGSYRSISCFTGNMDRRTHREGILGIVFESGESLNNLDLFLQRALYQAIQNPDEETIRLLFSNLENYVELIDLFSKVGIEEVLDIFMISGGKLYKNCLLNIGDNLVTNSEMIELYQKIIDSQELPQNYYYRKLDLESTDNFFLIFKTKKPNSEMNILLDTLKPYVEKFFYYTSEILSLFLYPMFIRLKSLKSSISKEKFDENKTVLQNLKKAENYYKEFNNYVSKIIMGTIQLIPSID